MLRFFMKHRGSVTILLAVIMIPMIVFSFSILDLCKIMMAKDTVAGAADLALNAGMTSFDKVMKDMYGILATSSNEEELADKMSKYYLATLNASGANLKDDTSIKQMITELFDASSDLSNNNLLQITSLPDGSTTPVNVKAFASSAPSNPKVLKRQIVEYMKYRGPVNLTVGMLEKINLLKDVPNQAKAAEKKIEFEKSLNKVNNTAVDTYVRLCLFFYNSMVANGENPSDADMHVRYPNEHTEAINRFKISNASYSIGSAKDFETTIKSINDDLINSAALFSLVLPYIGAYTNGRLENVYDSYEIDEDNYEKCLDDLRDLAEDLSDDTLSVMLGSNSYDYPFFLEKITVSGEKYDDVDLNFNFAEEKGSADVYNKMIDLHIKMAAYAPTFKNTKKFNISELNTLSDKINDFISLYDALENAEFDTDDGDDEGTVEAVDPADVINATLNESTISTCNSRITAQQSVINSCVKTIYNKANDKYNTASQKIQKMYETVCRQYFLLDELAGNDKYLKAVYDSIESAKTASGNYSSAINGIETESQRNNSQIIFDIEAKEINELDNKDYTSLKTYLEERKGEYQKIKELLESFYFLSREQSCQVVKKMTSLNQLPLGTSSGFLNLSDTKTAVDKYMGGGKSVFTSSNLLSSAISDTGGDLPADISSLVTNDAWLFGNKTPEGELVEPLIIKNNVKVHKYVQGNDFYKLIRKIATPTADVEKNEEVKNKVMDNTKTDYSSGKDNSDLPAGGNTAKTNIEKEEKEDSSVTSFEVNKDEYKSMATADTYADMIKNHPEATQVMPGAEKEPVTDNSYSISSGTDEEAVTKNASNMLTMASDMLSTLGDLFVNAAEDTRDNLYLTEYLTGNFSCFTTNRNGSLKSVYTETMLNPDMFFCVEKDGKEVPLSNAYRSELEYILYGLETPELNIAAAGGIIFGIRFVLNLVYSYTDPEIVSFTTSTATAAVGAFPFAIPIVQTLLHIGLSIAESGIDLAQLMNGASVPLFKDKTTWSCSATGIMNKAVETIVPMVAAEAIDTASEALCDVIGDISDDLECKTDEQTAALKDFIDTETEKIKSEVKDMIMSPIAQVVQKVVTQYGNVGDDMKQEATDYLNGLLTDAFANLEATWGTPEPNDKVGQLKKQILDYVNNPTMINNFSKNIVEKIGGEGGFFELVTGVNMSDFNIADDVNEFYNALNAKVEGVVNDVASKVNTILNDATDSLNECVKNGIKNLKGKLQDGVKATGEEMKTMLRESVNESTRGHVSKPISLSKPDSNGKNSGFLTKEDTSAKPGKTSSVISQALNMSYKDYLYIFTLIGCIANQDNMLMRTAQVMEANCIRYGTNNSSEVGTNYTNSEGKEVYSMNGMRTLFRVDVEAGVNTIFYGAVFNNGQLDLSGRKKYEFKHYAYMGY